MKKAPGFLLALATLITTATAAEQRTWVVADGRVFEGELVKVQGNAVFILDKDARQQQLDKSWLSIGDNEYIKEFAPAAKAGFATGTVLKMPEPARTTKIDRKTFKKAGTMSLPDATFDILETTHFKVMYMKGTAADDVAELAERLWLDAAFFHADFTQKFRGERMGIFIVPDDSTYDRIGTWYAGLLEKAGNAEGANHTKNTWPKSGAGSMHLPVETARDNGLLQHARVLRGYRKTSEDGKKTETLKGVWVPFFTHCIAGDMLSIQASGVSRFGKKGWFAVDTGHSYMKEIGLTGKSETNILSSQSAVGNDTSTAGGFKDSRNWASELKKLIRKGDVKVSLEGIYAIDANGASEKDIALVYGFSRYLQSSLPKLANYSKLIERVGTSSQMLDTDSLAKIYGFDSPAALEADLQKYLTGPEFR